MSGLVNLERPNAIRESLHVYYLLIIIIGIIKTR